MGFNKAYAERQFQCVMMQAQRAQAEIISGAYKLSKQQIGCGYIEGEGIQFRDMTEDEKLTNKMNELKQHIHIMYELNDAILENGDDEAAGAERGALLDWAMAIGVDEGNNDE